MANSQEIFEEITELFSQFDENHNSTTKSGKSRARKAAASDDRATQHPARRKQSQNGELQAEGRTQFDRTHERKLGPPRTLSKI